MAVNLSISITQNSQNVANNTSNVTVKVNCSWTYGSYNRNDPAGWLKIDGTKYDFKSDFNANQTTTGSQTLFTKTVNITHGASGAKTLACSASFATGVGSGTITASASKTLTTIPRATTPTLSVYTGNMGGSMMIYTPRASTSFVHDLSYSFAGGAYVGIATNVEESYKWTVPDLATSIPNATSGTMTIRCITKSGSTIIGTKTVLMTVKVPTSVVPTISAVTATEATSGLAAQFGAFIQGKSKIKAAITAAGAKGSTIKSYSTTFAGKTYAGSSWTSGLIGSSGTLNLVTTVTDSRGRTAKETTPITVLAYAPPEVYIFSGSRRNASGAADSSGTRIAVRYKYTVQALNNKNTAALKIEYKQSTAAEWSTLLTGSSLSADTTQSPSSPTFSADYQYDLRLTVTDYFGASSVYTTALPSGAVILDIKADGQGISFGKTADKTGVDFGWSAKGKVLGLHEATAAVPADGDLNEYLAPGVYAVRGDDATQTMANHPLPGVSGTLRVWSALGDAKISGTWAYLMQEYLPYNVSCPTLRRQVRSGDDGSWSFSDWRAVTVYGGRVLWEGVRYMTATHTAPLTQPIHLQSNGIVLVFSRYNNGALDDNFHEFFVPKLMVSSGEFWHNFVMATTTFDVVCNKLLYIKDDEIVGYASNSASGTATSGIKYNNAGFVLRRVYGV